MPSLIVARRHLAVIRCYTRACFCCLDIRLIYPIRQRRDRERGFWMRTNVWCPSAASGEEFSAVPELSWLDIRSLKDTHNVYLMVLLYTWHIGIN